MEASASNGSRRQSTTPEKNGRRQSTTPDSTGKVVKDLVLQVH